MLRMADLDLNGKRVLIRQDLNVPIAGGVITSDARLRAALPTLQQALAAGAGVMVLSHLGRPKAGERDPQFSLAPVASRLGELLGHPVGFAANWVDGIEVAPGEIVLCENVRFEAGEKTNDEALARRLAALCDIYVMDAFGTSHRAHASTYGVAAAAPVACAGPLLSSELDALGAALEHPTRPLVAVVGGSKVSTKLTVLESLLNRVDQLIVGGGIANTFILAAGHSVGKSLCEPDLLDTARALIKRAEQEGRRIPIPVDVVVATEFSADATPIIRAVEQVGEDELILDVGPRTAAELAGIAAAAGTVLWNGPLGVFEFDAFGEGTRVLGEAIAASDAFSVCGGGDTVAAIDKYALGTRVSYISTGGGAFLEFLEGKKLPAIAALEARAG